MNLQELKKEMPVIFDQVKKNVRKVYGRHRAGLNLGLIEMGMYRGGFIGGMHVHPGTDIVMNKTPLNIILRATLMRSSGLIHIIFFYMNIFIHWEF